jgi:hypothetical protein
MTTIQVLKQKYLSVIIISNQEAAIKIGSIMTVISEDSSVGTMGIQSQRQSSGKKKMKSRQGKMNSYFQPNEAASIQKPGVMNDSKVCKGCIYHSSVYKHGHDLTCPKSDYFGMTQKQKKDMIQE